MLDPVVVLESLAGAALTAAAVLLLLGRGKGRALGDVLGVGLGFVVGAWMLGFSPRWPPRADQDRLLFVLFPAVCAVEVGAAVAGRFRWLAWLPRPIVAAGAARLLLHNTVYLEDLAGPGTREWSPASTWPILAGLAVALAGTWAALALLARRSGGRSVCLALALACGGSAVVIMLSGYASAGMLGLPLSAALLGVGLASLLLSGPADLQGARGVGVVGLFGLLVLGRFFGELNTLHAVLLFGAPLLGWLPELPFLRRPGPRLRAVAGVVLTVVPLIVALTLAYRQFAADSVGTSGNPDEASVRDYPDDGK